jgi:hypothetical protein
MPSGRPCLFHVCRGRLDRSTLSCHVIEVALRSVIMQPSRMINARSTTDTSVFVFGRAAKTTPFDLETVLSRRHDAEGSTNTSTMRRLSKANQPLLTKSCGKPVSAGFQDPRSLVYDLTCGQNSPAFFFELAIAGDSRLSGPEMEYENSLSIERPNLDMVMLLNLEGTRRFGLG